MCWYSFQTSAVFYGVIQPIKRHHKISLQIEKNICGESALDLCSLPDFWINLSGKKWSLWEKKLTCSGGSRFSQRLRQTPGAPTYCLTIFFSEKCMKMKKFWPRGGRECLARPTSTNDFYWNDITFQLFKISNLPNKHHLSKDTAQCLEGIQHILCVTVFWISGAALLPQGKNRTLHK